MKQHAPYLRATDFATDTKDYDHEDVATDFHADSTLSVIANILASFGVFALLMTALWLLPKCLKAGCHGSCWRWDGCDAQDQPLHAKAQGTDYK